MLHDADIDRLTGVADQFQAADAIGLVLYRRKGPRFTMFRQAFLDGYEDARVSNWVEPRGIGPFATGYRLGAVWLERG